MWDIIHEALEGHIPCNGSVNVELHFKDFAMKDMYVTPRYKVE